MERTHRQVRVKVTVAAVAPLPSPPPLALICWSTPPAATPLLWAGCQCSSALTAAPHLQHILGVQFLCSLRTRLPAAAAAATAVIYAAATSADQRVQTLNKAVIVVAHLLIDGCVQQVKGRATGR